MVEAGEFVIEADDALGILGAWFAPLLLLKLFCFTLAFELELPLWFM